MKYRETLAWMFTQLPMYHRIGAAAYKANLDNIISLCNFMGNPQNDFDSIHVAGTNGKGSVSHLLASILQEHGLKTGLYTSPHLKDFRERIRVNGRMIPQRAVTTFVEKHREIFEKITPSFFEMTVGMAFDHFRNEQVDIAVVEVGMGGRLDSTNILTPLVSVITNISFDHMQFLGDTLEKIAMEKAGIIKPGIPVVIGETQPELEMAFREKARKEGAMIRFADHYQESGIQQPHCERSEAKESGIQQPHCERSEAKESGIQQPHCERSEAKESGIQQPHCERSEAKESAIRLPLKGQYQKKNLRTVLAVIGILRELGYPVRQTAIRDGIEHVLTNTGLRGRWEILDHDPLVVCDTGHNEAGIREVVSQLEETPHRHLHMVYGMVNDKPAESVLRLLPVTATYYFCKPCIPRGLDAAELMSMSAAFGLRGKAYSSVRKALAAARTKAGREDLIFIGGSTFVVAEVIPKR